MDSILARGPANAKLQFDTDTATEFSSGPVRKEGMNFLSRRFELIWVAGQRGKPSLNADIQNAAEGTREIADPDFEILGTNAVSASATFNAEGGITLTTAGADADQVILLPHLDANQSAWAQVTWGTDKETVWEVDFSTGAAITTAILWAGLKLTNTHVAATDNDQVFMRYENAVSGGAWVIWYSIGGVDVSVVSTFVVAVSTRYHLKVIVDTARVARVYLNGTLVATTTALTDATDLIPYLGVQANGAAAARVVVAHGEAIGRNIG